MRQGVRRSGSTPSGARRRSGKPRSLPQSLSRRSAGFAYFNSALSRASGPRPPRGPFACSSMDSARCAGAGPGFSHGRPASARGWPTGPRPGQPLAGHSAARQTDKARRPAISPWRSCAQSATPRSARPASRAPGCGRATARYAAASIVRNATGAASVLIEAHEHPAYWGIRVRASGRALAVAHAAGAMLPHAGILRNRQNISFFEAYRDLL
jgi:hypothetical protein